MVPHFPLEESFLSQHQRKKQKKHVKRCKVAPMQKDVYWPQHAGDFCRGTRGSQSKKGQLLSNEFNTMLSQLDTECQASLIQEDDGE